MGIATSGEWIERIIFFDVFWFEQKRKNTNRLAIKNGMADRVSTSRPRPTPIPWQMVVPMLSQLGILNALGQINLPSATMEKRKIIRKITFRKIDGVSFRYWRQVINNRAQTHSPDTTISPPGQIIVSNRTLEPDTEPTRRHFDSTSPVSDDDNVPASRLFVSCSTAPPPPPLPLLPDFGRWRSYFSWLYADFNGFNLSAGTKFSSSNVAVRAVSIDPWMRWPDNANIDASRRALQTRHGNESRKNALNNNIFC